MALPLRRRFGYAMTMPRRSIGTTPKRVENLEAERPPTTEPTPLPPVRPITELEAKLIYHSQKDMRKHDKRIPWGMLKKFKEERYCATEGRTHRLKRQGKLPAVPASLRKKLKKEEKNRRKEAAAKRRVRKTAASRAI